MNIEEEIFKKSIIEFSKLIPYGFLKEEKGYTYIKNILDDSFQIKVFISLDAKVVGKVYDLSFDDEYMAYRFINQKSEFAYRVREEFEKVLIDIRDSCCKNKIFISEQAEEISRFILKNYQTPPEFLFKKFPSYAVFRNPQNEKWYALIMNIDKKKIDKGVNGEVEVLNIKLNPEEVLRLQEKEGFYPAYHQNKKNWIAIILDGTVPTSEIIKLLKESHKYSEEINEWLVPANPKYFDIIKYFEENNIVTWHQINNIHKNDIVYIYLASPYSAVHYKCQVVAVDLDSSIENDKRKVMQLKLIKKYQEPKYSYENLKKHGLTSVRSIRRITEELSLYLESCNR